MKKILPLFAIVFLLGSQLLPVHAQIVPDDYQIVAKSDNPILAPGEQTILWTTLQNNSNSTWFADWTDQQYCGNGWCDTPNPIRLGTTRPQDRSSQFFTDNNWLSPNRVHVADQDQISFGDQVNFGFFITAPDYISPGQYTECFAPLIEGISWMADKGLCWDITIDNSHPNYDAQIENYIGGSYKKLLMEAGTEETLDYEVTNTGNTTWYRDGEFPVHLAVNGDLNSSLFGSNWLSPNRPAKLIESVVNPGEIGHFELSVHAPSDAQVGELYSLNMWLVAENQTWFDHKYNDPDIVCEVEIIADKSIQDDVYDSWTKMILQESLTASINYEINSDEMDMILSGYMEIDATDPDNSVANSAFDLSMNDKISAENYTLGLEMRQLGDSLSYIKLNISDLEKLGYTELNQIDGQWIKLDQEEIRQKLADSIDDLDNLYLINDEYNQVDAQTEEKIKNAIKYSGAIVVNEFIGTEIINGHQTNHYSYTINETQLSKAISLSPLYNNNITPAYDCGDTLGEAHINCVIIENIYQGEIYLGIEDNLLYKITMTQDQPYNDNGEFEIYLDNYGERFYFTEPDEYLTLDDLEEIFNQILSASPAIQSAMEKIAGL